MNVTSKDGRLYVKMKLLIEELDKSVKAMIRRVVAAVDQRIRTIYSLRFPIIIMNGSDKRVIFPEIPAPRPDVGDKLTWIPVMQVAHCRREHNNVSRRQTALKNELFHHPKSGLKISLSSAQPVKPHREISFRAAFARRRDI